MNGKEVKQIESHVTVSLEKYVDKLFEAKDEKIKLLFDDMQRAITKAEQIMDKRLESMNEFRTQLEQQASKFVTKEALDLQLQPTCKSVRELERIADVARGKASVVSVMISAAIAAIGFIIGIINLLK